MWNLTNKTSERAKERKRLIDTGKCQFPEVGRPGDIGGGDYELQTSSYKTQKSRGCTVQHRE